MFLFKEQMEGGSQKLMRATWVGRWPLGARERPGTGSASQPPEGMSLPTPGSWTPPTPTSGTGDNHTLLSRFSYGSRGTKFTHPAKVS